MKINELLKPENILIGVDCANKTDALKQAIKLMVSTGAIKDIKKYEHGVFDRERESTTGVGDGIAIPHCKSSAVIEPALVAMTIPEGVDYQSLDGEKVNILFLIAAPATNSNIHLEVLAKLSNILMHDEFVFALKKAKSVSTFLNILDFAEATIDLQKKRENIAKYPRVLAATACPTGIAHTYMAQEALEKAAKEMNISIKVETNGTGGVKNKLTDEEIEHADAIIVAADAFVEMDRFIGKRLLQCPVSKAIHEPKSLIDQALDPITSVYGAGRKRLDQDVHKRSENKAANSFHNFYKHLMSGISHMIPFVVAGGILLAIAYLIDACCGVSKSAVDASGNFIFGNCTIGAKIFHMLGADLGLGLMLPVLGGFIAYDIAGRPGLVSGFVGGFAASKGTYSLLYFILLAMNPAEGSHEAEMMKMISNSAAGFLGAIIAGFIAGYSVLFIKKKLENVPRSFEGVRDMIILPLLSTFFVGGVMLLFNVPIAYINIGITSGLTQLNKVGLTLLLAALVAGLMATDMGGPINKAAHYATLMILTNAMQSGQSQANLIIAEKLMCANIVGIMTPPIGIAIAIWLFPQKFEKNDRAGAVGNCVTGVFGITEGAIPFVAKDPIRVITSTVIGAMVGGMISFALGGLAIAPEGGTISMMVMGGICWVGLLSTLIGSIVTAFLLGLLKKDVPLIDAKLKRWKGIPTQPVYDLFVRFGNFVSKPFKKDKNKTK